MLGLLRHFMRNYGAESRDDAEYGAWYRHKVDVGERAYREGRVISQEEATRRAARRRDNVLGNSGAQ